LSLQIKNLIDEIKMKQNNPSQHGGQVTAKRSQVEALKEGWQQIKPLFFPPFLVKLVLVCAIQTIFTMK
jgi:VNT family MFS transporter (synaptic vesicle glycoprotein 2)